jgi:glycosyltransferase involved in cell wall biosynthesis
MGKLVSVIIPTVDGDTHVEKCTQAVRRSTYKDVEVVVVNEGLERSAQRNIGMKRAKGDYYLILDSDQMVNYDLIEDCMRLCSESSYGAVYIPEKITTHGFFGRLRNWERQFYTATPIDVVRFVYKYGVGEFDEQQHGTEDSDWDRRIKMDRITSRSHLYHEDDIGVKDYFKKKAYYAKSLNRFSERNPNDKILNFWWRCFGVYFENGKWKRCLKSPHYFTCIMGLNFIRGLIYIWQKRS